MTSKSGNRYSPELREHAVRILLEQRDNYASDNAAVKSIAPKIGCSPDTLRAWLRQHERQRLKELERENRELRRSNDILRQASAYFAKAEFGPPLEKVMPLLDSLRSEHWVGPVCHELNIAPSTYYRYREHQLHPDKRSHRDLRDDHLKQEIQHVYDENYSVYGVRKVWHQLRREGFRGARCTTERLMKAMGLVGVLRGKKMRTANTSVILKLIILSGVLLHYGSSQAAVASGKYNVSAEVELSRVPVAVYACVTTDMNRDVYGIHSMDLHLTTRCNGKNSRCSGTLSLGGHLLFYGAHGEAATENQLREIITRTLGHPPRGAVSVSEVRTGTSKNDHEIGVLMDDNSWKHTADIGSGYNLDLSPGQRTVTLHGTFSNEFLNTLSPLAYCSIFS